MKKLTHEEFASKAIKLHGKKYDYKNFDYVNSHIQGIIICPVHGEFKQVPASHLSGRGCPACGEEKMKANKFLTTDEFINRARVKHGDKYDYSVVYYNRSNIKVKINCPVHGEFSQTPNSHLSGKGCHKCFNTRHASKDGI